MNASFSSTTFEMELTVVDWAFIHGEIATGVL